MPFSFGTPLGEVLHYVQGSTTDAKMPSGVPLYLHPDEGYDKAVEKTRVKLNMEGVPLKTTLRILQQAGLTYRVQDGFLLITSNQRERDVTDSFQRGSLLFRLACRVHRGNCRATPARKRLAG